MSVTLPRWFRFHVEKNWCDCKVYASNVNPTYLSLEEWFMLYNYHVKENYVCEMRPYFPEVKCTFHSVQYLADHENISASTFSLLQVVSVALRRLYQRDLLTKVRHDSRYSSSRSSAPSKHLHLHIVARITTFRTNLPACSH